MKLSKNIATDSKLANKGKVKVESKLPYGSELITSLTGLWAKDGCKLLFTPLNDDFT